MEFWEYFLYCFFNFSVLGKFFDELFKNVARNGKCLKKMLLNKQFLKKYFNKHTISEYFFEKVL